MSSQVKREIEVVGAAIVDDQGRVLIVQRPNGDVGAGRWEFPGGKIDPGETPEQALIREIQEELEIQIGGLRDLGRLTHEYNDVIVHLRVFIAKIVSGQLRLVEHQALEWLLPREIDPERLIEADRPFVQMVIDHV